MTRHLIPLVLFAVFLTKSAFAEPSRPKTADDHNNSEEFQIGRMVKQIQAALKAPERAQSLEIIVKYGPDTRYYVMIRGWLAEELRGVESQLPGVRDAKRKQRFLAKQKLLKSAIRRIDLE